MASILRGGEAGHADDEHVRIVEVTRTLRRWMLCRVEVGEHTGHVGRVAVVDDVLAGSPHRRHGRRPAPRALVAPVANRKHHAPAGLLSGLLDGVANGLVSSLCIETFL